MGVISESWLCIELSPVSESSSFTSHVFESPLACSTHTLSPLSGINLSVSIVFSSFSSASASLSSSKSKELTFSIKSLSLSLSLPISPGSSPNHSLWPPNQCSAADRCTNWCRVGFWSSLLQKWLVVRRYIHHWRSIIFFLSCDSERRLAGSAFRVFIASSSCLLSSTSGWVPLESQL